MPTPTPVNAAPSASSKQLNEYQLGDSLGKGAFGQVYRALNWATGETVAVKEIQLSNIPKSDLGEIMSEIDLLKNLNHANIVKYKGFVKTKEFLYIILEFCENGSLHNICKRFGKFPENLVAVYISQVLEGLAYLHEQGVIHRDIKGANILTNKDGCVKLADFGVASKTTATDDAVVGSPYWMAPEVIEQSGATTASDIWSVGCVVIELLEGKPPYHFLDPMPALFRIVQDDCPPIPEGASAIVKDFLYHCFQKDVNLRISARKLLKHPWMISARKQMGIESKSNFRNSHPGVFGEGEKKKEEPRRPLSNYNFDEAVLKVQEFNEALKSPTRPSRQPNSRSRASSVIDGAQHSPLAPSFQFNPPNPSGIAASSSSGSQLATVVRPRAPTLTSGINPLAIEKNRESPFVLQAPEEQDDNWDDDFEEGISFTKLHSLDKTGIEGDEKPDVDENVQTIKPNKSPPGKVGLGISIDSPAEMGTILEDYSSDLAEDDTSIQDKFADFKLKNASRRGLFHPKDIKTLGLANISPGPQTAPLPDLSKPPPTTKLSLPPLHPSSAALSAVTPGVPSQVGRPSHARSSSFAGTAGSLGKSEGTRRALNASEFVKYTEDEEEDYEDVFGKVNGTAMDHRMQTLQLQTRLSNRSWLGDVESDEEDPFAEIDEGFDEDNLEANVQRDKHVQLCSLVNQLIDQLTPSTPDFQLRDACDQMLNILVDAPEMQVQLVSSHGMLAILEVLEAKSSSRDVTVKLLQIINMLVNADIGYLESFCLIGGIPVIMGFTSKKYSNECRLEASHFIGLLCRSSVLTLQMFISCRGLKVLVDLLDEDYVEQKDLVVHALNGIVNVFDLQSPTPKNDFCRMFIKEGLLNPLSSALINIMTADSMSSRDMKSKIIRVLLVFCQVSQSDIHVRNALGTRMVVRRLLRACELLEPDYLVLMLKAVKHLSMNSTLLDVLQNANSIEILVKILEEHSIGPLSTEMSNHIFQTCYNLCRLNKTRQEEAAQAGIIPCLKRVVEAGSPLKQFALPILCDLASATKSCRTLLWQHNGLSLYLKLLADPYFQVSALEAILFWLQDETARVEDALIQEHAIDCLVKCFVNAKANSFENLLEPIHKICRLSKGVAVSIAKSQFLRRLLERLSHNKAVVRLTLLRILKTVCDAHPSRSVLVEKYGLYETVEKLSKRDGAVLVRELAREILPSLAPVLRPSERQLKGGELTPKVGVAPKKKVRRVASESSGMATEPVTPRPRLVPSSTSKTRPLRQTLEDIPWEVNQRS